MSISLVLSRPPPGLPAARLARVPIAPADVEPIPGLADLLPEERAWAEQRGPRRLREGVAGRRALRAALRAVGWEGELALLAGGQGRPLVPPGYTGSISHKDGLAVAVAAHAGGGATLGVDTEVVGPRDRRAIAPRVLRPAELTRWRRDGAGWPALLELFSTKEAVYKALHPHVPRYIGFMEAEVAADGAIALDLEGGEGPFELRRACWWEGERLFVVVEARPSG